MRLRKFSSNSEIGIPYKLLLGKNIKMGSNFFSILVGANGTGKSRSLRDILDLAYMSITRTRFYGLHISSKVNDLIFWQEKSETNSSLPSKIIAISGIATDRFPSRLSRRQSKRSLPIDLYRYIGPRSESNLVSRAQSVQQLAISLLVNSDRVKSRIEQLRVAFKLLPIYEGIFFEFEQEIRPGGEKWTAKSIKAEVVIRRSLSVDLEDFSERLLEDCAKLMNDRGPVSLRLDLDESDDPIGWEPEVSIEAFRLALDLGILKPAEPYVLNLDNDKFPLSDFSSGQWQIFSSLLFTAASADDDTLILVDEPENSLHPEWQRQYLNLLSRAISCNKGVHVVVATHSPLIASSLPPSQAEVIRLTRSQRGNIASKHITAGPFGWTADEILETVFGLKSTRSLLFAKEIDRALSLFSKGDRGDPALLRSISKLEEFLPSLPENDVVRSVITTIASVVRGHTSN